MLTAITDERPEVRVSSRICRRICCGQAVYEKQYVTDDWDGTEDVIRKRSEREHCLLQELHSKQMFRGRLGVVRIASYDPQQITIATYEVPGHPLENLLAAAPAGSQSLLPWYLAGRWLRIFQSLSVPAQAFDPFSENDPAGLVEYCDLRLRSLREYGYRWPDSAAHRRLLRAIEYLENEKRTQEDPPVWVHADYAPGNIIWNGSVLTPIDFAMARIGGPLDDASYLIHRLEMHRIYRPWRRLPVDAYRQAILRGLGRCDAVGSPTYHLLMIKHLICRLHTYVRRPPRRIQQSLHDRWVRAVIRQRLLHASAAFPPTDTP